MTNVAKLPVTRDPAEIMENVIVKGDLSKLTPEERGRYYVTVCDSIGLNPLTKPFEYITLNGKLTLYALRTCTDQLRSIYKVSVEELSESEREGVFIVTAKVRNGEGRTDIAKGAVTITGLKGDALANALMKAETKAKRRATLSICGLGLLDETEIETIPNLLPSKRETKVVEAPTGAKKPLPPAVKGGGRVKTQQAPQDATPSVSDDPELFLAFMTAKAKAATTVEDLQIIWDSYVADVWAEMFPPDAEEIKHRFTTRKNEILEG